MCIILYYTCVATCTRHTIYNIYAYLYLKIKKYIMYVATFNIHVLYIHVIYNTYIYYLLTGQWPSAGQFRKTFLIKYKSCFFFT